MHRLACTASVLCGVVRVARERAPVPGRRWARRPAPPSRCAGGRCARACPASHGRARVAVDVGVVHRERAARQGGQGGGSGRHQKEQVFHEPSGKTWRAPALMSVKCRRPGPCENSGPWFRTASASSGRAPGRGGGVALAQADADARPRATRRSAFSTLRAMLFYIDEFPERLHHPKESDLLFPEAGAAGARADAGDRVAGARHAWRRDGARAAATCWGGSRW